MAQRLRSCAAPAEEPDLITSNHLRWFTTTNSTSSRGSDILFQPLQESIHVHIPTYEDRET